MNKIILILIVLCILNFNGYSQKKDLQLAIKKWEGLWKGLSGNDSLNLYIIQTVGPAEIDIKDKNYIGLYGWHSIKSKSKVIESSIESSSKTWNSKVTITGGYKHLSDSVHFVIQDLTRNMLLGSYLILINENEAILRTWMKETWRLDGRKYPEGQSFPKEIYLIRSPISREIL